MTMTEQICRYYGYDIELYHEGVKNGAYDFLYGFDPHNIRYDGIEDPSYTAGYEEGHLETQVMNKLYYEYPRDGFDPYEYHPKDKPPSEHLLWHPKFNIKEKITSFFSYFSDFL